ncbi:MAG: hypothetical protein AB7I48_09145 [Planctomycetaceae bacterium]
MPDDRINNLPLREKLTDLEKLTRELIDHLGRGFIPKSQSLKRLARKASHPDQRDLVSDAAIRDAVASALKSDEYTRELCGKTRDYLRSIHTDVEGMFTT